MPALRSGPPWGGALAGLAMWALVEFGIAPSLRQILDPAVPPQRKAELRDSVKVYARINLLLMLPVAFAMLLAAHLQDAGWVGGRPGGGARGRRGPRNPTAICLHC